MSTKRLNKKNIIEIFIFLSVGLYFLGSYNKSIENKLIKDINSKQIEIYQLKIDSLEGIDSLRKTKIFSHVYFAVKKYNPDIKKETIQLFIDVTKTFELDSTESLFNTCISQLLYESGAQHYYSSRYRSKSGQLVISSANAIGIAQITRPTCYDYLQAAIKKGDDQKLLNLGCDQFNFIKGKKYNQTSKEVSKWLKEEKNNLILWGYIIHSKILKNNGNIPRALISYNGGPGHLYYYLKNGNNPNLHTYVKHIHNISNKLT